MRKEKEREKRKTILENISLSELNFEIKRKPYNLILG
jgi:hypothetical protein